MKQIIKIIMMLLLIATVSSCTKQKCKYWYLKEGIAISINGDTLRFNGGVITSGNPGNSYRSINHIVLEEDFIEMNENK